MDSKRRVSWWLYFICAYVDGILGLPLLKGDEIHIRGDTSEYRRKGVLNAIFVSFIAPVGQRVRVLHGYLLRSAFSPAEGLRYDGLPVPWCSPKLRYFL